MEATYLTNFTEDIDNRSLWITATPSTTTLSLPFYIMEAGHFLARRDYAVKREQHNSFLLLYTFKGNGTLCSMDTQVDLSPESCAIIDCHTPHEYYAKSEQWEFFWIHFDGSGVRALLEILYPAGLQAITIKNAPSLELLLNKLLKLTEHNDIISCSDASSHMHSLFHLLLQSALESEHNHKKENPDKDIVAAVEFIQANYPYPITIDDMIQEIPISKYHFIRCFRRIMGVTPYSYLTNYRINMSKILLRSSDKSIADIAEACGFLDTSNFITQFKKHTGVRPTHYRRDFDFSSSQNT